MSSSERSAETPRKKKKRVQITLIEGDVWKLGMNGEWKKRIALLTPDALYFYKREKAEPSSKIPISRIEAVTSSNKRKYAFQLFGDGKTLATVSVSTEDEHKDWIGMISKHLKPPLPSADALIKKFPDLVPFVAREMRVDASKVDAKYLSGLTQSQLTQLKKKLDEQCEEELFAYLKTYVARRDAVLKHAMAKEVQTLLLNNYQKKLLQICSELHRRGAPPY